MFIHSSRESYMQVLNDSCFFRCDRKLKEECIDVLDGRSLSHFLRTKMTEEINKKNRGWGIDEHRQVRV